jgi:hypothetical protein
VWVVKILISFIVLLFVAPAVHAEVFTRVCLADGITPLALADPDIPFVYRPIMAGTHLTIIIDSNSDGYWNGGELSIRDANRDYGCLYERFDGSILPAAGEMAAILPFEEEEIIDEQIYEAKGFRFYGDDNATVGDWFVLDYNAISPGTCSVIFYDFDIDWIYPKYQMIFTHVRTRDFDDDGIVNFKDFVLLGTNWRRTDCQTQENCSGTDLDEDGNVDFDDLKMFANFWLERTR